MNRHDLNAFTLMLVLCALSLLLSCNAGRHNLSRDVSGISVAVRTVDAETDTVRAAVEALTQTADSGHAVTETSGRLDIERDSAGRPVTLLWHGLAMSGYGLLRVTGYDLAESGFRLRSCSSSLQADSTATDAREHTETRTESPLNRLADRAGTVILAVVLVYMAGTLLPKLWKK